VDVEAEPEHVLNGTAAVTYVIVLAIVIVIAVLAYTTGRSWSVRRRALIRLYAADDPRPAGAGSSPRETPLARWLARAGYRRPNAQPIFVAATIGFVAIGVALSQVYRLILFGPLLDAVVNVPGSAGDVLILVLQGGPWIVFVICALLPTLVVRAARRARVRAIEQDLPLALELFATMAEAGLGFDAALARIVRVQGGGRALVSEFVNFQHDMLAGMSRIQALRQLARRIDVPYLTSFTSALIQAEQVGASMAETLQHQAVDLRQRRRENALLRAQALPVKLVFPLVVCFLPGIFVSTLAPVLFQMVEVANSVIRSSGR
jgi:tight adherence protein C